MIEAVQTTCCPHETRLLCTCPQGFKSHAQPVDKDECVCGTLQRNQESWKSCSGSVRHVFTRASQCDCGKVRR